MLIETYASWTDEMIVSFHGSYPVGDAVEARGSMHVSADETVAGPKQGAPGDG